ncbi:flagellar cap protein FliD N-terminal domain-containing protein [Serratia marcescens]|uniref:flagellar cap protein FliD N-terminal domain-containing protein n=1 Tax=Serratia marcescens TaxID=615 RepID=UPI000AA41363
MASISSLGIGSGLDLNGLLDKLTKAEQQRLTPYTTQQTSYNAQLTAYGTLKGALEKFDNLSKDLAKPEFFNNTTATKHDQFTVHNHRQSRYRHYSIEVLKLAQPQTLTTQTRSPDQAGQTGHAGQQRSLYHRR